MDILSESKAKATKGLTQVNKSLEAHFASLLTRAQIESKQAAIIKKHTKMQNDIDRTSTALLLMTADARSISKTRESVLAALKAIKCELKEVNE